tara:strand:- start:90 stop:755 length:666 start_codon:yes stop_codon:yes gene_type:complete
MIYIISIIFIIFLLKNIYEIKIIETFENKKTFAVCFFGLTRSVKYTLPSIEKNIYQVLKENNINYEVYLHTYDLRKLNLKRSNENVDLDTEEWKLLKPNYYKIDSQEEFDKSYDYEFIKKYGDYWKTNFQNTFNLIRQFNSLKQLQKLINKKYDYYIILRPDLLYIDKLDINLINKYIDNKTIIITPGLRKTMSNQFAHYKFCKNKNQLDGQIIVNLIKIT